MVSHQTAIDGKQIADCIAQFRARRPHVHCITNSVAQNFTANVLLAAGAMPSMTINAGEVADFVAMADALLINLGTMNEARTQAISLAVDTAQSAEKPWALDPVFVQASQVRLKQAQTLLEKHPTLIRCNSGEAGALFGIEADTERFRSCASNFQTCIALTGVSDVICDADEAVTIDNGNVLMDRVTAMGCALTALMIGFLALDEEPLLCAGSAAAFFGLAGEEAGRRSTGPGSFTPAFLDALYTLSPDEIEAGVRLS